MNGGLYRGAKPVMWSVVERTALAEAEVEYLDHSSVTIWVRFPVATAAHSALNGASVVIWTTTPWTMPGNRAVAFGPGLAYGLYQIDTVAAGSLAVPGEKLVLGTDLAAQVLADAKVTGYSLIETLSAEALTGTMLHHPLRKHADAGDGYAFAVPLLPGDFVTNDTGTGFVHIAPGHGEDDWRLGMTNGIAVPETVLPDGTLPSECRLVRRPLRAGPGQGWKILFAGRQAGDGGDAFRRGFAPQRETVAQLPPIPGVPRRP